MDIKLSARSKHASSQRGRARHSKSKHSLKSVPPHQEQPASDPAVRQREATQLPSNWSRYEDEDALETQSSTDLPAVKSKGADYRELLSQKSSTPDLVSGRSSLMRTRGLHLLDWGLDVNSLWNKQETSANEASFLSLDIEFIGDALAKVDLAERLFIDPKFVAAEERRKAIVIDCEDTTAEAEDENRQVPESSVSYPGCTILENYITALSSASKLCGSNSCPKKIPISQACDEVDVLLSTSPLNEQPQRLASGSLVEPANTLTFSSQNDEIGTHLKEARMQSQNSINARFEAKAAEAELDELDDLLSTKVIDYSLNEQPQRPASGSLVEPANTLAYSLQNNVIGKHLKETKMQSQSSVNTRFEAKVGEAELDELDDLFSTKVTDNSLNEQLQRLTPVSLVEPANLLTYSLQNNEIGTHLKKTMMQSQSSVNATFEAKAAEAELDALLDMLDSHNLGASTTISSCILPGGVHSQASSSRDSVYMGMSQKENAVDLSGEDLFGTLVNPNLGSSDDDFVHSKGGLRIEAMPSAVHRGQTLSFPIAPITGEGKESLELTEDFDDWLDSL